MSLALAVAIGPYKNLRVEGRGTGVGRTEVEIPREVLARLKVTDNMVILEQHGQEGVVDLRGSHHHKENECARLSTSIA